MARHPIYSDEDILAAIHALAAEGEEINPMRVRMRLGGGNIGRIKAVIAGAAREPVLGAKTAAPVPEALTQEFERISAAAAQQVLLAASRCWAAAWGECAKSVRRPTRWTGRRSQTPDRA